MLISSAGGVGNLPSIEVEGVGKFEAYCCQRWRSAADALVAVPVPVRQLASGGEEEEVL